MLQKGKIMRKIGLWIVLGCWLCAGAIVASAGTRKAGLWELTTTMTWQQSPTIPGTEGDALKGGTHTKDVCLTQEMIDTYGALLPQSRGQCSIANKVVKPGGMTADWVCTGMMSGKGALESSWTDTEHAKGKVHFVGTFLVGSELQPVEWTTESTSVFKSADCGLVKPQSLPGKRH
jgi:hypothetical protein